MQVPQEYFMRFHLTPGFSYNLGPDLVYRKFKDDLSINFKLLPEPKLLEPQFFKASGKNKEYF